MKFFIAFIIIFLFSFNVQASESELNISRSFLGAYKKTVRFEEDIKKHRRKYDINRELAFAIAMFETGGNEELVSSMGAQKLFQVMPATFRAMNVPSNIEAGIKYLKILSKIFKKRDDIIMAYNGGPSRVKRRKPKTETQQYLLGVNAYLDLLENKKSRIKKIIQGLKIIKLEKDYAWEDLSKKLQVSIVELRLYNPFIAYRSKKIIKSGGIIVYPKISQKVVSDDGYYTVRQGDILHHLANAFGFSYDEMRERTNTAMVESIKPGTKIDVSDSHFIQK